MGRLFLVYSANQNSFISAKKPYYFYSLSSLYGLFGTVMYVNPFTTPFMVIKEVYRLEINMRGELDELKNKDEYYRVLL